MRPTEYKKRTIKFEPKQFDKHDPDRAKDFKEAMEYYKLMVDKGHSYVVLLFSSHFYSEGYWVESKPPVALQGYIVCQHDINNINPLKKHEHKNRN